MRQSPCEVATITNHLKMGNADMASFDFESANRAFREWYDSNYDILKLAEKTFRNIIQLLLSDIDGVPSPKVISRLKDKDECIKKFQRKYQTKLEESETEYEIKDYITDIIGIRVICLYESNINPILELLSEWFKVIEITNKTKILEEEPASFGYKGVHADLIMDERRANLPEYAKISSFRFEVQIRTIAQDAWSEIDHKLRYKKDLPNNLRRRIIRLAGLFEMADVEFDSIRDETEQFLLRQNANEIDEGALLNPFSLLKILRLYFTQYPFHEDKIEGFLEDIRSEKHDITVGEFKNAMDQHFERVREYRKWCLNNLGRNLNPYTMVRHVLYRYRPAIFDGILFERAKRNFTNWDVEGTIFPKNK